MSQRGKYDRTISAAARKKQQKRDLVVAATAVFARLGVGGASVEEIVRQAGMSRRTFYQHFEDLAAALAAVHDASGKLAMRAVDDAVAGAAGPGAQLEAGIRALLELISENSGLARVLFGDLRAAGPRFEARQGKIRRHFTSLLESVLLEAHHQGELARPPDATTLLAIIAGIEAVGARMAQPGGPPLDQATQAMVRLTRGAFSEG